MNNDNNSDFEDVLDDLLANNDAAESEVSTKKKTLKELNFNFIDHISDIDNETKLSCEKVSNEIHKSNTDSSDVENKCYFKEQKYSTSGNNIKILLKEIAFDENERNRDNFCMNDQNQSNKQSFNFNQIKKTNNEMIPATSISKDMYVDPIFGLRIVKPLISSVQLKNRMIGRTPITVSNVKNHITTGDLHSDWVIAGVLISKLQTQTSQKGNHYCIWKVSDLSNDMKTVSLFLFGSAYKQFWKITTGTVIGILNPGVLDNRSNIDQAVLSVDNSQKVMILGNSKDMGTCKSMKKNGEPCSAIVNVSQCKYCIYHVKQEYNKFSHRTELQSTSNKRQLSSSDIFKNKVPRKEMTMHSDGYTFTSVPAKKNIKMCEKDNALLALLTKTKYSSVETVKTKCNSNTKRKTSLVELTSNQMKKDLEKLNKLKERSDDKQRTLDKSSHIIALPSKMNLTSDLEEKIVTESLVPHLGVNFNKSEIDFSEPITKKQIAVAKMNALKWVQQNGAIKRTNPNKTRLNKVEKIEKGIKRQREAEEEVKRNTKKPNVLQSKFKELLETSSMHMDLIEQSQQEEKEKYFNKLEMKEKMEEKMMTTYQVDCKVVKCLICKYTAFSSSDLCKEQKHPLRIMNGVKRFFKCSNCGNRTISLNRLPLHSCKKCGSSSWARASMMDEKKTSITGPDLSIRGEEEKFIGSIIKNANLNLLVPESS